MSDTRYIGPPKPPGDEDVSWEGVVLGRLGHDITRVLISPVLLLFWLARFLANPYRMVEVIEKGLLWAGFVWVACQFFPWFGATVGRHTSVPLHILAFLALMVVISGLMALLIFTMEYRPGPKK